MFPSPVLLSAFRILSGVHEGEYDDFLKWLPEPASFAPNSASRCIDSTEWWLWRVCGKEVIEAPETVISENFHHLGRGATARQARTSDRFTEYDGNVPAAGADFDPTKPEGPVLSASQLETLGKCPMEYFFQYVLEIERLEEHVSDLQCELDEIKAEAKG